MAISSLLPKFLPTGDQGQIRALGKKLVQNKDTVALLGLAGEKIPACYFAKQKVFRAA